jgi:pantetheine-phosphate adenylyltransferase
VIERSLRLFEQVVVAIITNPAKQPLFTVEERREMLEEIVKKRFPKVEVDVFHGLLVDYAKRKSARAIIRGIRAVADYEYEFQMALMNRRLAPQIETVFMMPAEQYSYLSSRLVKEIAELGGSVKGLVPDLVERRLRKKLRKS